MEINQLTVEIVGGPDKLTLMSALSSAYDTTNPILPLFNLKKNDSTTGQKAVRLQIIGARHEDCSGHKFEILGKIQGGLKPKEAQGTVYYGFTAHYDTHSRKGTITLKK
jgi:hypothetical protein